MVRFKIQFIGMVLGAALCWGLFLWGCGEDANFLEGSISERFDLGFDFVEVEKTTGTILITYLDEIHFTEIGYRANNTILELNLTLSTEEIVLGQWIIITNDVKLRRYVVYMAAPYELKQDERQFPEVLSAEIGFYELDADHVNGKFKVIFKDGSTMRGGFSGPWL